MLAAAGFHVLPADTPDRQTELHSLTPLKMRFFPHNGKMHYWFADPYYCNCIYSGNEKAYDAYQRIELQQQMANQQELSAQMKEEAASQEYMNASAWPPNLVFFGGP
jgi:prepilin-type processing-associated H-X9-DG protein